MIDGEPRTWFVGPYGHTRSYQTARHLELVAEDSDAITSRTCTVEELFSDNECLSVGDYNRNTVRSLY